MVHWTQESAPIGISIGSSVFVGLMNVTNGHTDHANGTVSIGCSSYQLSLGYSHICAEKER